MPYVEYDEVKAVCSECGRAFETEEALRTHDQEAHALTRRARSGLPPPAPVTCSVCGRTFPSVSALGRHNRRDHTS